MLKSGILIKKSEILENAKKVNTIVFDKTGTLTYGKLKISKVINYSDIDDNKLLQVVGSIENKSTHPIAKAFTDFLQENKMEVLKVEDFENLSGLGIKAKIEGLEFFESSEFLLGNSKMLLEYKIENEHEKDEIALSKNGNSIVYVVNDRKIIAIIGVNDIVKENAKDVISTLNKNNIKTIMLTGDNKETAEKIAENIGISEVIANVLPKEKAEIVKKLKEENNFVMMCGDGINDSIALTSADIGVSVNTGTDIAIDSSDVILTNNDLSSILNLIDISKSTVRNIKQNLFWAFFYNALMIPIAVGVLKPFGISINPMFASLAMVISSITVILNAKRLSFK